ncbi:MAG: DUF2809 domain-containing protein [Clostridia bacterium]|nr:DUF2809 domain-containing protein [Clostridia bacterium]
MKDTENATAKLRLSFGIAAILLLLAEVLIALFVHDRFVRPYLGDVLVVILLYCVIRAVKPKGIRRLPLYLLLFAVAVEATQAVGLVRLLGLESSRFLCTLMGTAFSWWDILCYAAGCFVCLLPEWWLRKGAVR